MCNILVAGYRVLNDRFFDLLLSQAGYKMKIVSYERATDEARVQPYDLIILDIPGFDFDQVKRLRHNLLSTHTPILAVSSDHAFAFLTTPTIPKKVSEAVGG